MKPMFWRRANLGLVVDGKEPAPETPAMRTVGPRVSHRKAWIGEPDWVAGKARVGYRTRSFSREELAEAVREFWPKGIELDFEGEEEL